MNLWAIAILALVCALTGVALGRWFSKLRYPFWVIGYLVPLAVVLTYALAYRFPILMFQPPFSWIAMGIRKFVLFGFVATFVLTTPLSRVPQRRDRIMIIVLMVVIVLCTSVWPIVEPLVNRTQLTRLQTRLDSNGICLQSTDYTCGPAAAVTALRKLDFPAEEGQVAILSFTSDSAGTPPDMLAEALQKQYGSAGLRAHCRNFKDLSELRRAGLTLAVIKYNWLSDHWITVFEVTDSEVVVGDPLLGLVRLSHADFRKRWRFVGIVLERKLPDGTKLN